jgi:hypothetical protein
MGEWLHCSGGDEDGVGGCGGAVEGDAGAVADANGLQHGLQERMARCDGSHQENP